MSDHKITASAERVNRAVEGLAEFINAILCAQGDDNPIELASYSTEAVKRQVDQARRILAERDILQVRIAENRAVKILIGGVEALWFLGGHRALTAKEQAAYRQLFLRALVHYHASLEGYLGHPTMAEWAVLVAATPAQTEARHDD